MISVYVHAWPSTQRLQELGYFFTCFSRMSLSIDQLVQTSQGMIVFAIGAGVTIHLAIATLLLNLQNSPNIVDLWILNNILPHLKNVNKTKAQRITNNLLLPILFASNDSQLLTGFIFLLAGWISFFKDNLSVNHFSMIVNMARSATNSQLIAFFALQHLQDESVSGNEEAKIYLSQHSRLARAALMMGHFIMLFAAATIQSHREWHDLFQCPAACVVASGLRPGGSPLAWTVVNYCLLIWGYGSAIITSFDSTSTFATSVARYFQQRQSRFRKTRFIWATISYIAAYLESMTVQILFPCGWFALGLADMLSVRYYGKIGFDQCGKDILAEVDGWGFGQIVPILYLLAPLLPSIDTFGHYRKSTREREDDARGSTAEVRDAELSTYLDDSEAAGMDIVDFKVDEDQTKHILVCTEL